MTHLSIVITGGPCGAKTRIISAAKEELTKRGYAVYTVNEAASELLAEGHSYERDPLDFQRRVLSRQLENERRVLEETRSGSPDKNVVILFDRSLFDGGAYIASLLFSALLFENGLTEEEIVSRYQYVFHLQSLASSDIDGYGKNGNPYRYENKEKASELDRKFAQIYKSFYPSDRYFYIPVFEDFEDKRKLFMKHLFSILPPTE